MSYSDYPISVKFIIFLFVLGAGSISGALYSGFEMNIVSNMYGHLIDGPVKASRDISRANRMISDISTSMYWSSAARTPEEDVEATQARKEAIDQYIIYIDSAFAKLPEFRMSLEALKGAVVSLEGGVCGQAMELASSSDPANNKKAFDLLHTECRPFLKTEPPRVCRRPFGLSYAAMAGASSLA